MEGFRHGGIVAGHSFASSFLAVETSPAMVTAVQDQQSPILEDALAPGTSVRDLLNCFYLEPFGKRLLCHCAFFHEFSSLRLDGV